MRLFSPWALGFLSFIPLVIIMYILKQKFEEKEISSIQLWKQVLKDIEVNTPWQKLKRNILLFLQLLLIMLLILAMADPLILIKGSFYSNLILVIDNTGSMSAIDNGTTRLEHSKKLAEAEIRNSGANTEITIISSGRHPKVEIARAIDKTAALSKLRDITSSKSAGNINDSVSLVEALAKQYQSYKALFYTDAKVDISNITAEVVSMASKNENVSLDYISHSTDDKGLKVMLRITNRGSEAVTREVSLYAGDKLLDIMGIELSPETTKTIYFDDHLTDSEAIWAEISEADGLLDDNVIYDVVRASETQRVLMVTTQNVFIEKALLPISSIELYKTNPQEDIKDDYDLYIYDGSLPDVIPTAGSILLINPPEGNSIIKTGGNIEGGISDIELHPVTKYMDNSYFIISSLKDIEAPYWATTLIKAGDHPAVVAGEYKGRRLAVIAFDLHNTDFALTTEYPIFMHNLMEYLINITAGGNTSYFCGESIQINPAADSKAAQIISPSGKVYEIELKYPILPFTETYEQGIYKLRQVTGEKAVESLFSVNFPSESESDLSTEAENEKSNFAAGAGAPAGRRVQTALILIALMLIAIEWVVYVRGY